MRITYLLLHDFRFASTGFPEFASHGFHFSKEYARRMAGLGHEVSLYVLGLQRGREELAVDGYRLEGFATSFRFPPLMKFGNDHSLGALRELSRESPDVIHIHNYYLWNFPYVALWAKRTGARVVAQFHGTDPIRRLKGAGFYPSLRLIDGLLAPTKEEREHLTKGLRIPTGRVRLFPSTGVNTEVFRRNGPPKDSRLDLLYAGRVPAPASYLWEKAPLYLLPMLRALADRGVKARLTVAGDGPGLPTMRDYAKRLKLEDSVDFLGALEQSRLPRLYSQSSLSFSPIQMDDIEPFWGGTVQESLACGTPVVAFNNRSPGFRRFGLLVPTDPHRAAELLATALAEPDRLSSAREQGPSFVAQNCTWEVLASRLDRIYQELAR